MSADQLDALLAKLKGNEELKQQFKSAASLEQMIALAQAQGFAITQDDWLSRHKDESIVLSDSELEAVAGGAKDTFEQGNRCSTGVGPWCADSKTCAQNGCEW